MDGQSIKNIKRAKCDEQWTSEKEKKTSTAASGILYGGSDTRRANKGKRSNDKSSKLIEQHTLYH